MSATELRQAAETLRALAKAATEAPWDMRSSRSGFRSGEVWGWDRREMSNVSSGSFAPDAEWIATLHPGVGILLAQWLFATADSQGPNFDAHPALALARLINGGAS